MELYESAVITRHENTVESAPEVTLFALELLTNSRDVLINGDSLYIGKTPDGEPVTYRVVGWDAEHKALIVERT